MTILPAPIMIDQKFFSALRFHPLIDQVSQSRLEVRSNNSMYPLERKLVVIICCMVEFSLVAGRLNKMLKNRWNRILGAAPLDSEESEPEYDRSGFKLIHILTRLAIEQRGLQ
jgi:hypothetical protein